MTGAIIHPLDVVHHQASGQLAVRWSNGLQASLSSHALRCACRCAACEKLRRAGLGPTTSTDIRLMELHSVGELGLQLYFDDGHDRGIYPWPYLHELSLTPHSGTRP